MIASARSKQFGLSLIEVLVVLSILGVLIGLLLPAVQSTREAARKAHCINNLRQIGVALHSYHAALGSFPTSLWRKTPDPVTKRSDNINRHSWCSMLLNFVEQTPIHNAINFSVGIAGGPGNIYGMMNHSALLSKIDSYACPSDPSPSYSLIPRRDSGVGIKADGSLARSGSKLSYQGNLGDNYVLDPMTWPFQSIPFTRNERLGLNGSHTGIMSRTGGTSPMHHIIDGTSTTFAVGESLFESCDWFTWPNPNGTISSSEIPLNLKILPGLQYVAGESNSSDFGSCMGFRSNHPGGVNFLFCDGHVVTIKSGIDRNTFRYLSTRSQGEFLSEF
jgi:prepilin-type processing-associated H-X9-DG protein/prepilin-type N-terminal cleavage/methylation domain-containing protein